MPLQLVRASDARTLWDACVDRFLADVGDHPGPHGFAAHAWLAQESQVDQLYEAAQARGLPGWLGPPVTMLRRLAPRFDIRERRLGLLTRRRLISRLAGNVAAEVGLRDPTRRDGVVRGHMLDALFGELLPEGVTPDALAAALAGLADGDDFTRRRNDWIVGTYAAYHAELAARERVDARQTNAMVAARIDEGGLREALDGAGTLHLYGLYMARSRQRLLHALAEQAEVDVSLYVLREPDEDPEPDEWQELVARGCAVDDLVAMSASPEIRVQPAPDTQRETEWVARQVKRLLVERELEPHRIAVVARSGHEDTGRIQRALRAAGVQATTIVRARLTEIAALKALLTLFRGAAEGWTYAALRPVLDNTLLDIDVDLRLIDFIAYTRRVEGLAAWEQAIESVLERLRDTYEDSDRPRDRDLRGSGLWADSVAHELGRFQEVRRALEDLDTDRGESAWIDLTLRLLRNEHPAAFNLRRRLCEPPGRVEDDDESPGTDRRRWDAVRLDQRGVRQAEVLLREWLDLDHSEDELDPGAWRHLLHRMLEANELAITTPVHKGVQVLEAHDAALLPFEHVFVVHANDGEFPRRTPSGGVVTHDERARLREAGIPLAWRELELRRERALWRAVTSAGEITVTYRTADPAGTPLLPSLLVPEHAADSELPRTRTRYEADDETFAPVTAAQADQRAAAALHDAVIAGAEPCLAPGDPARIAHAVVAAVAERHRDTGAEPLTDDSPALSPSPWNGWLRDPAVLAELRRRFGPDYVWSASSLETYSKLPFQFLLARVLRCEEAKEADEEVTPLVFGWMAHDLLEKFYTRVQNALPRQFDATAEAAFEASAQEVLDAAREDDRWLGAAVFWEQQWQRIREQVRAYLEWELEHLADKGEAPALIEHSFGFDGEPATLVGKDVAGLAAQLHLRGRIDRVDRGSKGYQVLDYKSGGHPGNKDYDDGSALQAPLYMQVLENAGHTVHMGYYRSLKPAKRRTQYGGKILRDKGNYDTALRFALSIPGRVRAGMFEPVASVKSKGWAPWHPGREIARSQAVLGEGHRYDRDPLSPEPGPDELPWLAPAGPGEEPGPAPAPPADDPGEPASPEDSQRSLFDLGEDSDV